MIIRYGLRQASTAAKTKASKLNVNQFSAVQSQPRSPRSARHQIRSKALCDDVLERLRPSLPAPNTCDLIDVNPGVGVWSRKLHSILQPRRHVLVEPDLKQYGDDLQPLLKESESRYRHAALLQDVYNPETELLSEYDTHMSNPSGRVLEQNRSLLMTVNLSGASLKVANYKGSPSKKFFDDFYLSLFKLSSNIHRYGQIRILAWIPDEDKDAYVPRTVSARRKQAVLLEASSVIEEVAGASPASKSTRYRRWPEIDIENISRVHAKERGAGIDTPVGRRDEGPARDLLSISPTPDSLREASFTSDAEWVSEFIELDDRLRKDDPVWYQKHASLGLIQKDVFKTPNQKAWKRLLGRAKTTHKTRSEAIELVKQTRNLMSEWVESMRRRETASQDSMLEQHFQERAKQLEKKTETLARTNRIFAEKAIDDFRALDMTPPILSWNQRESQPLIVHDDDFRLSGRYMALLDVVPRTDFLSKINTNDKMILFGHVLKTIYINPARSVLEALKSLVHEGVDEFVKTIPTIHDPSRGGWYDLTKLRVRSLPAGMFIEIALAYEKWPFRQSTRNILLLGPDIQSEYRDDD